MSNYSNGGRSLPRELLLAAALVAVTVTVATLLDIRSSAKVQLAAIKAKKPVPDTREGTRAKLYQFVPGALLAALLYFVVGARSWVAIAALFAVATLEMAAVGPMEDLLDRWDWLNGLVMKGIKTGLV